MPVLEMTSKGSPQWLHLQKGPIKTQIYYVHLLNPYLLTFISIKNTASVSPTDMEVLICETNSSCGPLSLSEERVVLSSAGS